jgi:Spy/CpxP family protein refolding chaperone
VVSGLAVWMGMRGMGQDMYDQVGLDEKQKAKMTEIQTKYTKKSNQPLRNPPRSFHQDA